MQCRTVDKGVDTHNNGETTKRLEQKTKSGTQIHGDDCCNVLPYQPTYTLGQRTKQDAFTAIEAGGLLLPLSSVSECRNHLYRYSRTGVIQKWDSTIVNQLSPSAHPQFVPFPERTTAQHLSVSPSLRRVMHPPYPLGQQLLPYSALMKQGRENHSFTGKRSRDNDNNHVSSISTPSTSGIVANSTALPHPVAPVVAQVAPQPATATIPPAGSSAVNPLQLSSYRHVQEEPWPDPNTFVDIRIIRSPLHSSIGNVAPVPAVGELLSSMSMSDLTVLWNSELFKFYSRPRLPSDPPIAPSCTVYVRRLRETKSSLLKKLVDSFGIRCICCRHVSNRANEYQSGSAHFTRDLTLESVLSTLNMLKKHMLDCQYSSHLVKAKIGYHSADMENTQLQRKAFQRYLEYLPLEIMALSSSTAITAAQRLHLKQQLHQQHKALIAQHLTLNGWNPSVVRNGNAQASVPAVQIGPTENGFAPLYAPPNQQGIATTNVAQATINTHDGAVLHQLIVDEAHSIEDEIIVELDDVLNRAITYHSAIHVLEKSAGKQRTICSDLTTISPPMVGESAFTVMLLNRLQIVQCLVANKTNHPPLKRARVDGSAEMDIVVHCAFCKGEDDPQNSRVSLRPYLMSSSEDMLAEGARRVCRIGYVHSGQCRMTRADLRSRMSLYIPQNAIALAKDLQFLRHYFKQWLAWISRTMPISETKEKTTPIPPRKDVSLWIPVPITARNSANKASLKPPPQLPAANEVQAPSSENNDDEKTNMDPSLLGLDDVTLDGYNQDHVGNRQFWVLVSRWQPRYWAATKTQQLAIIHQIIFQVINQCHGRFVVAGREGPETMPDDLLIRRITEALEESYLDPTTIQTTPPSTDEQDVRQPGSGVLNLEHGPFRDVLSGDVTWQRFAK